MLEYWMIWKEDEAFSDLDEIDNYFIIDKLS
jgi:hypothetical protein